MKIGIIGAGNIGAALAARWVQLGHEVTIANSRGPETLAEVARETGAEPLAITEVAKDAEVVVVTVPMRNVPAIPHGALDVARSGAVFIDTNNYYPRERDGRIEAIEDGMTESRWVSEQLGRPVVKAFNNIYAAHLRDKGVPAGSSERFALPVAGDDPAAKATVMSLVEELGFDAVDAGSTDESWRQQPGTPAYGTDGSVAELESFLAQASPVRDEKWRA